MHGVMGSNPDQVKTFFSGRHHVVILHYTKNYYTKVLYFPEVYNHTSLYALLQVVPVSIPPLFVCNVVLPTVGN
jgi:hypothetical protein